MTSQGENKVIPISQKKKRNWDGLYYGGKPLDDYFSDEKEKQKNQEIKDDVKTETKRRKKVHIKEKYQTKTRGHGKMTTVPQNQVNKDYLQQFLDRANGLKQQIVLLLISGGEWHAAKIIEELESRKRYSKQQVWNVLSDIMRSQFSDFIKRKKVVIDGAKQYQYECTEEGCILPPKEAHEYAATKLKKGDKPKKKKETKGVLHALEDSQSGEDIKENDISDSLLEKIASQTLNVVVSGGIDITFRLKIN